jgi:hypothetical protein
MPTATDTALTGRWRAAMDSEQVSAAINEHVARVLAAQNALIEEARERALQGGVCGVRVWRHDGKLSVAVDPSVSYGHVYEMVGQEPPSEWAAE